MQANRRSASHTAYQKVRGWWFPHRPVVTMSQGDSARTHARAQMEKECTHQVTGSAAKKVTYVPTFSLWCTSEHPVAEQNAQWLTTRSQTRCCQGRRWLQCATLSTWMFTSLCTGTRWPTVLWLQAVNKHRLPVGFVLKFQQLISHSNPTINSLSMRSLLLFWTK